MKKITIIAVCLLITACNPFGGKLQNYIKDKLVKDKGTLKLSAFNDEKWNRVYILGPYTNDKMLDKTLAHYKKEIMKSGILTDDGLCLVMIFNGEQLVDQAVFDNQKVDFTITTRFTPNAKYAYYDKDKANFPYTKKKITYILRQF